MIERSLTRTDPPTPRAALPTPLGKAGHLGRKTCKSSQTARPEQKGLEKFRGRSEGPVWSHLPSPCPFSHHHLSGLHGNPAGPTSSGEVGLDHHSPTSQPTQPPRPPPSAQPPARAPAQMGISERSGPRRSNPLVSERDIFPFFPGERKLSFEKWWDKGTEVTSQQRGRCTVFIFKTTKVQTDFALFSTFFFFLLSF